MINSATNRVAVVSGGARGIGAAIAARLVADGHSVAIFDRDPAASVVAEKIQATGGTAIALTIDVTHEGEVTDAFSTAAEALGAPTILINNAGVTRDNLLFRMSESDWDTVMDVHLKGTFLMSKAAQSHMVKAGWGRIVNLSSTSAHGNRGQANYSAAKAGLVGFSRTLAIELGRFGITCNAIAPGFIDTAMLRDTAQRLGTTFEDFAAEASANIPAGRLGTPEDVASTVAFLISDDASYISGELLHIGGGFRG
jgi:3-oxoacyl-[acyl-carrier protein] reductase